MSSSVDVDRRSTIDISPILLLFVINRKVENVGENEKREREEKNRYENGFFFTQSE